MSIDKFSLSNERETFETICEKADYIQSKEKHSANEYWYVMKDLFNSLECVLIICILMLLQMEIYQDVEHFWFILATYFGFLTLFWFKSRFYAKTYIRGTQNTFHWLNQIQSSK